MIIPYFHKIMPYFCQNYARLLHNLYMYFIHLVFWSIIDCCKFSKIQISVSIFCGVFRCFLLYFAGFILICCYFQCYWRLLLPYFLFFHFILTFLQYYDASMSQKLLNSRFFAHLRGLNPNIDCLIFSKSWSLAYFLAAEITRRLPQISKIILLSLLPRRLDYPAIALNILILAF